MTAQSRLFSSNSKSWEALCNEAAAFASEVGRERLIDISVAASGGTEFLGMGTATEPVQRRDSVSGFRSSNRQATSLSKAL